MDSLQAEDTMDLASSPFAQVDEDLELDALPDVTMDHHIDSMNEQPPLNPHDEFVTMQLESGEYQHDDDMVDEESLVEGFDHNDEDLNMEPYPPEEDEVRDGEDILVEDEEEILELPIQNTEQEDRIIELEGKHEEPFGDVGRTDVKEDDLMISHTAGSAAQGDQVAGEEEVDATVNAIEDETAEGTLKEIEPFSSGGNTKHASLDSADGEKEKANEQPEPTPYQNTTEPGLEPQTDIESTQIERDSQQTADPSPDKVSDHELHTNESEPRHHHQELYLHPVKVIYQENEICLFPPTQEETLDTFFLSDTTLAHESLDKLLNACREVLAGTIGDDDELVLDIASLGLHVTEDSKYANQITLSQILDVYLALSHNDNVEQVEPLYCSLTSRVCLASQYTYLSNSAQSGKTYTEISTEYLGSPEESADEYGEENTGQPPSHQTLEGEKLLNVQEEAEEDSFQVGDQSPDEGPTQEFSNVGVERDPYQNYDHEKIPDHDDWDPQYEALNQGRGADKSPTSTVRGDEAQNQGEYDPNLDICTKPGVSLCFDCNANLVADDEPENHFNAEDLTLPPDEENEFSPAVPEDPEYFAEAEREDVFDVISTDKEPQKPSSTAPEHESNDINEDQGFGFIDSTERDHTKDLDEQQDLGELDIEELLEEDDGEEDDGEEDDAKNDGADHEQGDPSAVGDDDLLDLDADPENSNKAEVAQHSPQTESAIVRDLPENEDLLEEHSPKASLAPVEDDEGQEDLFDESSPASNPVINTANGNSINGHHLPNESTPITPSKAKSSKRKINDEDDDFDLLEIGTPEIKRRRPS